METAMIQTPEFERIQPTDPREAKLMDIIEKGRASLQKALEEIQHEFSIREDMAVKANRHRLPRPGPQNPASDPVQS